MSSSFSQFKCVIDFNKIFCQYCLLNITSNAYKLFQLGTLFPVINTNIHGIRIPKQLHKYNIKSCMYQELLALLLYVLVMSFYHHIIQIVPLYILVKLICF